MKDIARVAEAAVIEQTILAKGERRGLLKAAGWAEEEAERQRKGESHVSYALGLQEFAARLRARANGEG